MIYSRCKCGNRQSWHSGFPPANCEVCEKCGFTLASSPNEHKEPVPHEWALEVTQRGDEVVIRKHCLACRVRSTDTPVVAKIVDILRSTEEGG